MNEVDILGRKYTVKIVEVDEDEDLKENDLAGYTCRENAQIVVRKEKYIEEQNHTLRHELIHAFLFESGLGFDWEHATARGHDETTVDWFAKQWPKIQKVFETLGCDK